MTKTELIEKRKEFFENIIETINHKPQPVDYYLRQAGFHKKIEDDGMIIDATFGDLWLPIKSDFYGLERKLAYSIWQYGNILKLALVAYDHEVENATSSDQENEFLYLWGKDNPPKLIKRDHTIYLDWEFQATGLYDNYVNQEFFVLGMRHMHFRILRMLHDQCKREFDFSKKI